ncbi:MAG: hypothetical protein ACKVQS_05285 [Fimbriimonadaceae bacterium]
MRKLLLTQLFVATAVFASTCAQAQWTELIYDIGTAKVTLNQEASRNNGSSLVYASGAINIDLVRNVNESMWNNFQPGSFPTSPNWKSGFTTLSSGFYQTGISYSNVPIPAHSHLTIFYEVEAEIGENTWEYGSGGNYGTWSRWREWEVLGDNHGEVIAN